MIFPRFDFSLHGISNTSLLMTCSGQKIVPAGVEPAIRKQPEFSLATRFNSVATKSFGLGNPVPKDHNTLQGVQYLLHRFSYLLLG